MIHLLHVLGMIGAGLLLWRGADVLVDAAARLAKGFGVSDLVVGLTVVAMGTSAPELAVSTSAALDGAGAVALGNVVGSNIFNLGIVLGGAALLAPLRLNRTVVYRDGGFLVLSTLTLYHFLEDGVLSRAEAGIFCAAMAAYLLYLAVRRGQGDEESDEEEEEAPQENESSRLLDVGKVLLGIAMVIGGGKLLVSCAVALATAAGLSPWLISVTIVAAGTSAPEMVTTLSAVRSGHQGMAIGGLFGSDIFNVLLVLGVAGTVAPLHDLASYQDSVLVMAMTVLGTLVLCQVRGGLARRGGAVVLLVALTRWVLDALGG